MQKDRQVFAVDLRFDAKGSSNKASSQKGHSRADYFYGFFDFGRIANLFTRAEVSGDGRHPVTRAAGAAIRRAGCCWCSYVLGMLDGYSGDPDGSGFRRRCAPPIWWGISVGGLGLSCSMAGGLRNPVSKSNPRGAGRRLVGAGGTDREGWLTRDDHTHPVARYVARSGKNLDRGVAGGRRGWLGLEQPNERGTGGVYAVVYIPQGMRLAPRESGRDGLGGGNPAPNDPIAVFLEPD